MKKLFAALAVALALTPAATLAQLSLGVEATLAAPRLGVERMPGSREPLGGAGDVGGVVLLRLGPLGLGASMERGLAHSAERLTTRSAMGGLVADLLPFVRLELLGEVGVADLAGDGEGSARFRGFRPGLSLKLPAFPLRLGLWGLARWGIPGASSNGPSYGLLARAGIEL